MDIETERIDLRTFQKMWNGEIDAVHDQMVDALENKYVWKFVLDETYNGSAKVFEFFMECEMPSRYALINSRNSPLFTMSYWKKLKFRDSIRVILAICIMMAFG